MDPKSGISYRSSLWIGMGILNTAAEFIRINSRS